MRQSVHAVRIMMVALTLVFVVGVDTAPAQQPSGSNPTALSVREDELLRKFGEVQGQITIPDEKLAMLEHPQGRDYRRFHERVLPWIGGIAIVGMIVALAAFYFVRGPIRYKRDEKSGRKILRFKVIERFTHWMTATSFIVLAITGLNYFFGKRLLLPLLGPDAFATWSHWAKYAHNFMAWPFMLGVLLMAVLWLRDNLPDRYDIEWLKAGGGFFGEGEPPAGRFNAGQKLIFWAVLLGGGLLSASGIVMLFPFWFTDIDGMQAAQYVHATMAVIMIAIIIAHIYIGTLGMQGAWDAMGSGEVDLAWASQHHRLWVDEQLAKSRRGPPVGGGSAPAPAE
ncbi:MAG TPA: formate dehydrogenase subunit gamma [Alphaproteobacteria bacterium]